MLSSENFRKVVKYTNLMAFDLIIKNSEGKFLLAKRNNSPAKGYYFVPGGRVHKGECLNYAFERILKEELGLTPNDFQKIFHKGLYNHIYDDNFFEKNDFKTHYIVYALELELNHGKSINLDGQHSNYQYFSISEVLESHLIHRYVKNYFLEKANNKFIF